MTFLMDTHVLIWYTANDPQMGTSIRSMINDPLNTVYVSIVSCSEISIKLGLGKLELLMPLDELLDLSAHGLGLLEVSVTDVAAYSRLEFPLKDHRDPFDRMIAVQAMERGARLITADPVFKSYMPAGQVALV